MAGFLKGLKRIFVGEDEEEQVEYQPNYDNSYDNRSDEIEFQSNNSVSANDYSEYQEGTRQMNVEQTQTLQLVLARPAGFDEVKSIGKDINEMKTVILNLEMVKSDDAKRILDFLSGVAFANEARIEMMAQKTFAIMAKTVKYKDNGIDLLKELENNGYSF
jgi:cell division inhibitor SepF